MKTALVTGSSRGIGRAVARELAHQGWAVGINYLNREDKARELGLYMQKYCGCVFSEEDRYRKRKKKAEPKPEEGKL